VERVTDVTYFVKKVRGRFRKSQGVHFINLRLYRRRQEGSMERKGTREAANAPQLELVNKFRQHRRGWYQWNLIMWKMLSGSQLEVKGIQRGC